ncbi:KH domain-containing protein [Candidatus Woesebacteria bacterium]|nr:KH domain-containing protein [Candidatus Woesebacteria bacterium]
MTIDVFVKQLCEHCGIDPETLSVTVDDSEELITVNIQIPEEDSGRFIGFHGETLESIQRVLRVIFAKEYPEKKLVVNINQYREERAAKLQDLTRSVAERVLESGQPYMFQSYLPAHERFIIHSTLSELADGEKLESISDGDGKDRRLTIRLKQA